MFGVSACLPASWSSVVDVCVAMLGLPPPGRNFVGNIPITLRGAMFSLFVISAVSTAVSQVFSTLYRTARNGRSFHGSTSFEAALHLLPYFTLCLLTRNLFVDVAPSAVTAAPRAAGLFAGFLHFDLVAHLMINHCTKQPHNWQRRLIHTVVPLLLARSAILYEWLAPVAVLHLGALWSVGSALFFASRAVPALCQALEVECFRIPWKED